MLERVSLRYRVPRRRVVRVSIRDRRWQMRSWEDIFHGGIALPSATGLLLEQPSVAPLPCLCLSSRRLGSGVICLPRNLSLPPTLRRLGRYHRAMSE